MTTRLRGVTPPDPEPTRSPWQPAVAYVLSAWEVAAVERNRRGTPPPSVPRTASPSRLRRRLNDRRRQEMQP